MLLLPLLKSQFGDCLLGVWQAESVKMEADACINLQAHWINAGFGLEKTEFRANAIYVWVSMHGDL